MIKWEEIKQEVLHDIEEADSKEVIDKLKVDVLGKKGMMAGFMQQMKTLSPEEKREFGQKVNELKKLFESTFSARMEELIEKAMLEKMKKEAIDITLPGARPYNGSLHPLNLVQQEIEDIFISMGYSVVEGPEVELDFYNFERANIPQGHPARDMQDTFYIDSERLLRTHTTAIQTRTLEALHDKLPIKVICPGKVYRRDDDDATHSHQFVQMEGLVVAENITLSDLKGTLELLARKMFGDSRTIRLRPSYFQFTEPSVEVDVSCHICGGKGCPVCKGTGWIEILGAGMVHPNVLEMAGIDSKKYTGFAFGVGVERVAMLKYGIDDIRNFYINDIRFLKAFTRFE
ncbi:MAG: phenylalanine--tRNA ligase subunit alpha [Erysipelotrichaceae bacterium]|nr:phenylalanine--tRNA ligase subunit alpha [Erysipelotrichaceae bacterium]